VKLTCTSDVDLTSNVIVWTLRTDTTDKTLNQLYINNTGCYTVVNSPDTNYIYSCGTTPVHELYLTIPAPSMTENQNGVQWWCSFIIGGESNKLILSVAGRFGFNGKFIIIAKLNV